MDILLGEIVVVDRPADRPLAVYLASARFIGAAIAASMLAPRSIAAMADSGCVLEI
jgi:hypothetical protein